MRVEDQRIHSSRAFQLAVSLVGDIRSSSGTSWRAFPRHCAKSWRSRSRGSSIGTRRATGLPRLVMTISCLVAATSSIRARQPCLNTPAGTSFLVMDIVYGHLEHRATEPLVRRTGVAKLPKVG